MKPNTQIMHGSLSLLILPLTILVVLAFHGAIPSLSQSFTSTVKVPAKQSSKRKIKISPAGGYILLPEGYKAYSTKSWVDAWYSYIESPDGNFRINISAGLVQSPFETYKDKFVWTKTEKTSKGLLKFGLKRTDEGKMLMASSDWVNFTALIKREGESNVFMEIVHSYREEKCDDCGSLLPARENLTGH